MKYSVYEEEALCSMAQGGDELAEEELIKRCNRIVRSCSRPLFLMGGDQEDLMQEGLIGLIKAIQDYDSNRGCSFTTFAETCIRNRMLSAIRSAAGKHHIPLNDSVSIETTMLEENRTLEIPGPEDIFISRETVQERMDRLRSRLSGFETQVLELYLSGLSIAEISAKVQRPLKSVDNAIQRVRRKIDPDGQKE